MPNHLVSITRHRKAAAPSGKRSRANRARQFKPCNYPVTLARFKQVVIPNQTAARTRYCGSNVVTLQLASYRELPPGEPYRSQRARAYARFVNSPRESLRFSKLPAGHHSG